MGYEIRNLGIGEILDQAVKLMRTKFWTFMGIGAILLALSLIFQYVALGFQKSMVVAGPGGQMQINQSAAVGMVFLSVVYGLLLALVVTPLTNAAMTRAIAGEYLGQSVAVGQALSSGARLLGKLILTNLLCGLIIILGSILIVPGIIFLFRFFLTMQVVALEERSGMDALRRSRELMKTNWGKAFVLGLVILVMQFLILLVTHFVPVPVLKATVAVLIQMVVTILALAAWTVFYFSARCKAENFDLEMLAKSVEGQPAGPQQA